jgi:hypothetical protein
MMCWAMPEQVLKAIERQIENLPATNAMPRAERVRRVGELEAQLLALEQREEALIEQARETGVEILRRPDIANPGVVLGVVVVAKAKAAAA